MGQFDANEIPWKYAAGARKFNIATQFEPESGSANIILWIKNQG